MSQNRVRMPSKKILQDTDKKLRKGRASFVLPPELAKKIGIPETRVSEIVHYRIEKFTVDRLLGHLEKLNPKVSLRVA